MFDECSVNFTQVSLRSRRGVRPDLTQIIHDLWFRNAREIEEPHGKSSCRFNLRSLIRDVVILLPSAKDLGADRTDILSATDGAHCANLVSFATD
jgi:hypothetical protein